MSASDGPGGTAAPDEPKPEMWSRERVVTGWAQLWNVPNLLTLARILLIPVFWYLLMFEDGQNSGTRLAATSIFVIASITDWLDGYLARRQGLVTTFGKIADPLADKALTGAALIGLSVLGELWWWVTAVILLREIGVTLVRLVVLKHGVIPASRGGKLKTTFQMVGIVMFLLPIDQTDTVLWIIRNVIMGIAVLLTVLTGADYVDKAYRTRSDSKAAKAAAEGQA
jgi:CDP-diacylglycerol--glycerol-3-phosphate 3-phosphatidyltransferase